MTEPEYQDALVKEDKTLSIVWLLPVIALIIGGWLLFKSMVEAPIEITINFSSGTGLEVGKTKVIYEGIAAGVVTDIVLDSEDMKGVLATVEVDRRTEPMLRESTQFWLVKPEISLRGVTGLETIVSGNYIGVKLGKTGKRTDYFVALDEPPPMDMEVPGLHLNLRSKTLGSVHVDAPVLYKQIIVGSITQYLLDQEQDNVAIKIHIKPEYANLVNQQSRFWNVSGFKASADLSGIDVQAESLVTLVQGGIAFDSPADNTEGTGATEAVRNNDDFTLYEDYDAARRGIAVDIVFSPPQRIQAGKTKVMLNGFEVGTVKKVNLSEDHQKLTAQVSFDPMMESYLTDSTRFWLIKPEISLSGVSGLDTLISGSQIEMEVRPGEPSRRYQALNEPPKVDYSRPGLHLKLDSKEVGSVNRGTPVLYRQMRVGQVQAVSLSDHEEGVVVDLTIDEPYQGLVNSRSRFWNASGIDVYGSLTRIKVRAESLATIVQGGIAFSNPDSEEEDAPAAQTVGNGDRFTLYQDYEQAMEKGIAVRLRLRNSDGVEQGTLLKYRGYPIGEIRRVELDKDLGGLVAHAILRHQGGLFAVKGTRFWLVKPELGITGASNLDTLVKGQYFDVEPGQGRAMYEFEVESRQRGMSVPDSGLNIVLETPRLGSIRPGLHLHYRDVVVGVVTGFTLSGEADKVLVFANIEPPYDQLVRKGTRFWNASGVRIDVGLFSGASIRSESLETILAGGISFATPPEAAQQEKVDAGTRFVLNEEADERWLQWAPKIQLEAMN